MCSQPFTIHMVHMVYNAFSCIINVTMYQLSLKRHLTQFRLSCWALKSCNVTFNFWWITELWGLSETLCHDASQHEATVRNRLCVDPEHLRSGCADEWVRPEAHSYWLTLGGTRLWLTFSPLRQDDGPGYVSRHINASRTMFSISTDEGN